MVFTTSRPSKAFTFIIFPSGAATLFFETTQYFEPFLIASFTKECPSNFFPLIATKILFFFILLEYEICSASFMNGIIFGLISVIVPWFFFMPALGKGLLGTKTTSPLMACSLAVGSHIAIGAPIGGFYQIFGY